MAKQSFRRRFTRKIKRLLRPDEAQEIIKKEFIDSKGNKSTFRFDFSPHSPKEPTIQGGYNYGENK